MEVKNGYKAEKFTTNFTTDGWLGLYMGAMIVNILVSIIRIPLPYIINDGMMSGIITTLLSVGQAFLMVFLIVAAYSKAIIVFINTLSLDGKRFSTNLDYNSIFSVMLANILLSIFTIGIYIPWGYKAIIDKIVENTEYEGNKCFKFSSYASQLFSFIVVSIVIMFILAFAIGLSIVIVVNYSGVIGIMIFPIMIVLFIAFFAVICAMQVFTINWAINLKIASDKKNATYTLNLNVSSAILFYLGQTMLLVITFGFYVGAYMMNIYDYFVSRTVEKTDGNITGHFRFVKPIGKGAGFLLGQVILTHLTAGFYSPFALVEYSKFFINNTYLDTIKTEEETETILISQ
jgi:membrane protein